MNDSITPTVNAHFPVSNYAPGFYANLSNEAYHADPSISSSGLKMFAELPRLFYMNHVSDKRPPKEEKDCFSKGKRIHTALLEPETYAERYAVAPYEFMYKKKGEPVEKLTVLTKKHKKFWSAFQEQAEEEGKEAILHREKEEDYAMVVEVLSNDFARRVFTLPGQVEASFFATCPDTGLPVRARPDKLVELPGCDGFEGGIYIIDLKTTAKSLSNEAQIHIAMRDEMRHIQASFHKMVIEQALGTKIKGVVHIVCDVDYPFFYRCLQLQPDQIDQGNDERIALMLQLAKSFEKNSWPGYEEGIQYYIDTPSYLRTPSHYALQIEI
jgi:exodeoxyribonuclease VIII